MNESGNTSYHTEIRGKAMAYWHVFGGGGALILGSVTSRSQKMQKIR